jgi:predicted nucleic acid-binding protein
VKILLDTNVILDVLLDRRPFSEDACVVFSGVERGMLLGCLCATTATTVYYLVEKALGGRRALAEVKKLLMLFEVAPVGKAVLETAMEAGFADFEDAVVYASGLHAGVDGLVTRNQKDFKPSSVPVYSPVELVAQLTTMGGKGV